MEEGRNKTCLRVGVGKTNTESPIQKDKRWCAGKGGSLVVCLSTGLVVVSEMQRSIFAPVLQSSNLQACHRGPNVGCDMVRAITKERALVSLGFMFLRFCTSIVIISLKIKLDSD